MTELHRAKLVGRIECLRHDIDRINRLLMNVRQDQDRVYWRSVLAEKWRAIDGIHAELEAVDEVESILTA